MSIVKDTVKGFVIGSANVIPGVSGGTMALLMGIYSRTVDSISRIDAHTVSDGLQALKSREKRLEVWKKYDVTFLLSLTTGAGIAVVTLARVLKWALSEAHDPTYGFFFGLVLCSIWAPFREVQKVKMSGFLSLCAGVTIVIGLAFSQSAQQRVQNAYDKSKLRSGSTDIPVKFIGSNGQMQQVGETTSFLPAGLSHDLAIQPSLKKGDSGRMETLYFFLSGAIAISAMILPGVSGAFVLLLLGMYFRLLEAISQFQIVNLCLFAIGCVFGLALFSKILKHLLARAKDLTMMFLTGLVAGSVVAIWPFQSFVEVSHTRVDLGPIWNPLAFPHTAETAWSTATMTALGFVLVMIFYKMDQAKKKDS